MQVPEPLLDNQSSIEQSGKKSADGIVISRPLPLCLLENNRLSSIPQVISGSMLYPDQAKRPLSSNIRPLVPVAHAFFIWHLTSLYDWKRPGDSKPGDSTMSRSKQPIRWPINILSSRMDIPCGHRA